MIMRIKFSKQAEKHLTCMHNQHVHTEDQLLLQVFTVVTHANHSHLFGQYDCNWVHVRQSGPIESDHHSFITGTFLQNFKPSVSLFWV